MYLSDSVYIHASEIISCCFWFAAGVAVLYVLEVCLGEFVRERLRRLLGRDDT